MKRWGLGWLCVLLASVSLAVAAAPPVKVNVEASMLLTGSIVIATDGSVHSHSVDHPEKLTPALLAYMDKVVSAWKFEPVLVDGKPVLAKAQMSVRLVANPTDGGEFTVRVKGASFGNGEPGESISTVKASYRFPEYPRLAAHEGAGGTVYLLVKVGRQGEVLDVAAEQVNLTVSGSAKQMASWRNLLVGSSVKAAKRWKFNVPTVGAQVDDPYWVARIPVAYSLGRSFRGYGEWETYVPGPREIVPWVDVEQVAAGSVDTMPEGSVLGAPQALKLLSPLSGS